jgi:hypothetical protein
MKTKMALVMVLTLSLLVVSPAFAAGGGMPAAHGVDGKAFGGLVGSTAQSSPGAIADHVSSSNSGGGAPGAHGVDGRTFGELVSWLAQSWPGAVADHVSGK